MSFFLDVSALHNLRCIGLWGIFNTKLPLRNFSDCKHIISYHKSKEHFKVLLDFLIKRYHYPLAACLKMPHHFMSSIKANKRR